MLQSRSNSEMCVTFTRTAKKRAAIFTTMVATVAISIWDSLSDLISEVGHLSILSVLTFYLISFLSSYFVYGILLDSALMEIMWLTLRFSSSADVSLGSHSDVNSSLHPCLEVFLLAPMPSPSVVLYSCLWDCEMNQTKELIKKTQA